MAATVDPSAAGLRQGCMALAAPRYELIPLPGVMEEARALPAGALVTVTCSPRHGIDHTLDRAEGLAAQGFQVVPHIAARLVRNRGQLQCLLDRLAACGLREIFLVGGDVPAPAGPYPGGLELLEALAGMRPRPERIGVPAYPEGHASIDAGRRQAALQAKSAMADYAVTQLCFEPQPVLDWLQRQRDAGLQLPMHVGLPGVIECGRLLSLGMRLGLGPSMRMLRRQRGLLGALLASREYTADDLVWQLAPLMGDPRLRLTGFHLYTFNRVRATRDWLERMFRDVCQWHGVWPEGDCGTDMRQSAAQQLPGV